MPLSLAKILEQPPTARRNALIIECHEYAETVLLQGGAVQWEAPMACANLLAQAYTLLGSDAAVLDLGRFVLAQPRGSSALQTAMGAKPRNGYALRTLLSDAAVIETTTALVTTVTATQRIPVILSIPSPGRWLAEVGPYSSASAEPNQDDVENAAIYLADWLRAFGGAPLAAIMLDHRGIDSSDSQLDLTADSLSPLANLAKHYDWDLIVREDEIITAPGSELSIGVLRSDFWLDDQPMPEPEHPHFTSIPSGANPEHVLRKLKWFAS